jgi:hypothetical protein
MQYKPIKIKACIYIILPVEIDSFISDKQDNYIYVLTKTLQQSKQLEERLRKGVKECKTFGWCINTLKGTQSG